MPQGQDPLMHLWTGVATDMTGPSAALSSAVYGSERLSLREFEAARVTIARINDCVVCMNWRSAELVPSRAAEAATIDEEFYDRIGTDWDGFTERELLSSDFARRFAVDHLSMDDAYWTRLRAAFTDEEIVDLGICVGAWIAQGRLQRVLDVDGACRVPSPDGPLPGV